jgi:hypothetical protein
VPAQLSLLAAGFRPPAVADLAGLLIGGGQLARLGGTARLSVLVEPGWRATAISLAYQERDLPGDVVPTPDGLVSVRTPFSRLLHSLAEQWVHGAVKSVPPRHNLDGPQLRLWVVSAGRAEAQGFLLRLGPHDEAVWERAGAALAAVGLPATFLGPRADGPAYRVVGRRRIARLAEYVGEPPTGASDDGWPV